MQNGHNTAIGSGKGEKDMCTAVTFHSKDHYFGRTLDLEYHYDEQVVFTPRNFPFVFRMTDRKEHHHAIIGMATVVKSYPLYYEAANECGLAAAGLNFPGNACFYAPCRGKINLAPFEFIPWLLSECGNLAEARKRLEEINLCDADFSPEYPASPLHWMIADKTGAITVECMKDGMRVFENPIGILTNNPPFDYHMTRLADFMNITGDEPENRFGDVQLSRYSKGMGAIGLPGDLSSSSRFVRAAFVKLNSVNGESEEESVSQFFHILGSVNQQRGCARLPGGKNEITVYSSCINLDKGIFYYTTYENSCVSCVDMRKENPDGSRISAFALSDRMIISRQN